MNRVARHGGAVLLALGVGACQPPAPPLVAAASPLTRPAQEAAANDDDVPAPSAASTLDHAGDVLIGQRVADLGELGPWSAQGAVDASGGRCDYYQSAGLPEGVVALVDDGNVVRFDLGTGPELDALIGQPGPYGIRLGMTRARALALLPGDPVSSPHNHDGDPAEYLTWQDPASDLALRLELHEANVARLYWGTSDAVELIEGCS